jgi:hypothetical protein
MIPNQTKLVSNALEVAMKDLINRTTLFAGKIDRRTIQLILIILSLSLLVIGAGAPGGGGLGNPGNGG